MQHAPAAAIGLCSFFAFAASAAEIHVPGDFATIQAAINAASNGDEVIVAPGTHLGNITLLGKDIVLRSTAGPEQTTIMGTNWAPTVACTSNEPSSTVIEGFTIRGMQIGVQVTSASPTFIDCIIRDHEEHGVRIASGNPTFTGCIIRNNMAGNFGGGVYITGGSADFEDCHIIDNFVGFDSTASGGGLRSTNANVTLTNCIISNNTAQSESSGGHSQSDGGAIFAGGGGLVTLIGCRLENNSTNPGYGDFQTLSRGGAIYGNNLLIIDTEFINNRAIGPTFVGAGFFETNPQGGAIFGSPTIVNSSFRNNAAYNLDGWGDSYGGAISGSPSVSNTQFCGNSPDHINGAWTNEGGNLFSEHCPIGDLTSDGVVDVSDLLALLSAWGSCPRSETCPADFNGDGTVDISDLLILLANWG